MITYQSEQFDQCIDEIKPLLHAHYEEISEVKDITPMDPDYEKYREMAHMGLIRFWTVRNEGVLIGYFITFIMKHPHYKSVTYGLNDVLYLDPAYRGGMVGYKMFRSALHDLKITCGVQVMHVHMKTKHEFRALLTKLGFRLTEETWEARL